MSAERRNRHVLDELLAQSVQAPAPGTVDAEEPPSVRAPAPSAREPARGARERAAGWADQPGAASAEARGGEGRPAARSPMIRNARRGDAGVRAEEEEVQVGRGPLALHLSRAATQERLAAAQERLGDAEERLGRAERRRTQAEERLAEQERLAGEARGALAKAEGRLAEARKHVLALEERLAMTEESESHAREQQARSEESCQALTAQLEDAERRRGELERQRDEERGGRERCERELERLRGSLAALGPVVSGIEQATSEIRRVALRREGGGTRDGGGPEGVPARHGSRRAGSGGEVHGEGPEGAPVPPPANGTAAEVVSPPVSPGSSLVRALTEVVEHWRGPGPRPTS